MNKLHLPLTYHWFKEIEGAENMRIPPVYGGDFFYIPYLKNAK